MGQHSKFGNDMHSEDSLSPFRNGRSLHYDRVRHCCHRYPRWCTWNHPLPCSERRCRRWREFQADRCRKWTRSLRDARATSEPLQITTTLICRKALDQGPGRPGAERRPPSVVFVSCFRKLKVVSFLMLSSVCGARARSCRDPSTPPRRPRRTTPRPGPPKRTPTPPPERLCRPWPWRPRDAHAVTRTGSMECQTQLRIRPDGAMPLQWRRRALIASPRSTNQVLLTLIFPVHSLLQKIFPTFQL